MHENLVIVESPAKAKTIEKFLGKDYVVKSSFGHIRDLSKKGLGLLHCFNIRFSKDSARNRLPLFSFVGFELCRTSP